MFSVPEDFATYTIARAGKEGREWIANLPALVARLCKQWNLVIEGATMHGGLSVTIPVHQHKRPCILKVGWVDSSTEHEALALKAWNGKGVVQLLDVEPAEGAMLLERLDSNRSLNAIPLEEALPIAGSLLRRLAIPAPAGFPHLKEVGLHIAETLPQRWEQCGQPLPRRLLDRACHLAGSLAPFADNLLVNYDLIFEDVLAGKREPWLVVDPKVVVGDPEYGVAQLLLVRLEAMQEGKGLATYFDTLVSSAQLDLELARLWTVVRCVDYWLWGLSVGLTEDPKRCKAITDWLI